MYTWFSINIQNVSYQGLNHMCFSDIQGSRRTQYLASWNSQWHMLKFLNLQGIRSYIHVQTEILSIRQSINTFNPPD